MEQLGLNPVLLLAQLVSFGIFFFVLSKFLYSPIRKSLRERTEKIRKIYAANAEFEKKLEAFEQEKLNLEKKKQEELRKLILETRNDAEKTKKEILEQADIRGKKILDEAVERIAQERAKASNELKAQAVTLAKEMAGKILAEPSKSNKMLNVSIDELDRVAAKSK